ncbi:MAG: hypothetical protein RLZZ524_2041, partial [Pseudomonadota bacterium]
MSVNTSAGSILRVSTGTPATFDVAGYAALTYVIVGEVTDLGEFGREYNLVTHNPIATRGTQKHKGSFNEGQMAIQLGLDTDDSGQALMKAASLIDGNRSFSVTTQNGDVYYFQAKVMSWKVGVGNVDQITSANSVLELTTSDGGIGVVVDLSNAPDTAPTITAAPSITSAIAGSPLAFTPGSSIGNPTPTNTYAARVNGTIVASNITSGSYTLGAGTAGQPVVVVMTAANGISPNATANSPSVNIAASTVAPTITVAPAVTGTPREGQAINFSAATATGTPAPTLAYDLLLNDVVALTGITSGVTLYPAGSSGQVPKVRVTASNGTLPNAVATSAAGPAVAAPFTAPAFTSPPAITGTPTEGQPITGTAAVATGNPSPTITYELLLDDVLALSSVTLGATTYPAGSGGKVPKLRATATNSQGSATSTSAAGP